jgi:hypothetical protein
MQATSNHILLVASPGLEDSLQLCSDRSSKLGVKIVLRILKIRNDGIRSLIRATPGLGSMLGYVLK